MIFSRPNSLLLVGCGYESAVISAALIDDKEHQDGRNTEIRLTPRRLIRSFLREVLAPCQTDRIYLIGLGLNLRRIHQGEQEMEELAQLLASLRARGVDIVWLCNWSIQDDTLLRFGDYLRMVGGVKQPLEELTLSCLYGNSPPPHAVSLARRSRDDRFKRALQMTGFVTRVMSNFPDCSRKALQELLSFLQNSPQGKEFSPLMSKYNRLFLQFGRREIRGKTEEMENLRRTICRVAAFDDVRVLILGETGTGKESVATHLHLNSPRWDRIFLSFNCASTNPHLLEADFRGVLKGAFTGASANRPGIFEQANGGTLFLDEIGDLPLEAQGCLLRILEEKRVTPIGGSREIDIDVRLITATNKNLCSMVREGRFRGDLLYRLKEFTIRTCPLRRTKEDIPRIAYSIWKNRTNLPLPQGAEKVLMSYDWPGNTRELTNFLKFVTVQGDDDWEHMLRQYLDMNRWEVDSSDAGENVALSVKEETENMGEMIARHCHHILERSGGNISQAARRLGIQRNTLKRYLSKYSPT